ncbi:MAG: hypothetical protein J6P09_05730 [Methanobrevibacter sp.]|nr:hypothetical protein [Methanobrevibacter sp.]MBO6275480.1 hypothetical protein [Methanobrevibacter sp.]
MVTGYDDIHTDVSESVTIMGVQFWAENIQSDEPENRREREFTPILGGTERVMQGKYIHREFSFTTTWYFPEGKPHVYDNLIKKMMSKPVEVKSKYMGGNSTFKAIVKISQTFPEHSPNHMDLDVTVTEVPGVKSRIPGESFKVPKVEKIKVTSKKTQSSSKKSKSKSKKSKSKTKSVKKKNK